MSPPDTQPDGPTTETAFQEALSDLIKRAHDNGVDVNGGWEMREVDGPTDYGIEIYRVEKDGRQSGSTA